jgi:membrane fusion protein, multidrug efflux system
MPLRDRVRLFCCMALLVCGTALVLSGCKPDVKAVTPSAPTVEIAQVIQRDVPVYTEWTATTDGLVNATIRAQVQGYLIKREYGEGDFVRKGQVLFQIDPRTFQAALDQAKGLLSEQQARWQTARANLERIRPLVEQRAVSLKDLDDAVGAEQASRSAVIAAQAVLDKAKVDLEFTRMTSPIDGIAGIARAQIGNLVGPGSIEELTTVSTVDPIKVYVSLSEQEYLRNVQKAPEKGKKVQLQLLLVDGSIHPRAGTFAFADRQVDVKTGTIRMAALFPNPGNILRPGQFARVRAETAVRKAALLVPQRAVTELQGRYQVAVVDSENKVTITPVTVGERINRLWVIDRGLKPGQYVIAEGLQKVRQGTVVVPQPYKEPVDNKPADGAEPSSARKKG